jgi:hypothetical protein
MDPTNVGNMNGYYGRQYPVDDLHRVGEMNHDGMMGILGPNGMDPSGMVGGQTLDEIINQNNKELQRRRSYNQMNAYAPTPVGSEHDLRRASMLEFGSGVGNPLDGFPFDPNPGHPPPGMHRPGNLVPRRLDGQALGRRDSAETLALNTHFQNLSSNYSPIPSSPFQPAFNQAESLGLDMAGNYMTGSMLMGLDYPAAGMGPDDNGNVTPMTMFPPGGFAPDVTSSPLQATMPDAMRRPEQDPGGGTINGRGEHDDKMRTMQMPDPMPDPMPGLQVNLSHAAMPIPNPTSMNQMHGMADFNPPAEPAPNGTLDGHPAANGMTFQTGDNGKPPTDLPLIPQYRNAYSSSGFDMLGVLMRVATRPKPQINIGAVDMSCAFVVCDVTQHDLPIVYCSDIFERLTAYTKHEILGRNCRFLQAPDGKIQAGVKRKYVDDQSVLRIKNMINQRQEAQISVINYRKGGQPFMNLLTMIPITWDSDEVKYYVGFQVDLVEQPTSITNKNPGEFDSIPPGPDREETC